MKRLLFAIICSASILLGFNSCNSAPEEKAIPVKLDATAENKMVVPAENKEKVKMKVDGMVCAMGCAKFIEEQVADVNGVVSSEVDFEEGIAIFEFDKTATDAKKIETFINEIHDGQYKAIISMDEGATIEDDNATENKSSLSSVRERFTISFPELFTYFIKRLR